MTAGCLARQAPRVRPMAPCASAHDRRGGREHGDDISTSRRSAPLRVTLDGSGHRQLEDETFCADSALVVIEGPTSTRVRQGQAGQRGARPGGDRPNAFLANSCRRPPNSGTLPTPVRPARRRHPRRDSTSGACVHGGRVEGAEDSLKAVCEKFRGAFPEARISVESRSPTGTWPTDSEDPKVLE